MALAFEVFIINKNSNYPFLFWFHLKVEIFDEFYVFANLKNIFNKVKKIFAHFAFNFLNITNFNRNFTSQNFYKP